MKIKDTQTFELMKQALEEDHVWDDVTSRILIPSKREGQAALEVHENGILCGILVAEACFKLFDKKIRFKAFKKDGEKVKTGDIIGQVKGSLRSLLSCERVALNFLNRLSGIATLTSAFAEKVKPYGVRIYDTRKTTPLLRNLEKYAVRTGGGYNHRMNLSDAIFIKDNHIEACGGIEKALRRVFDRKKSSSPLIVEVRNTQEAITTAGFPVDLILLDNMKPSMIEKIIKYIGKKIDLEISGGINLKNVVRYAQTGISRISIGSLTHSSKTLDISMEYIHVNK